MAAVHADSGSFRRLDIRLFSNIERRKVNVRVDPPHLPLPPALGLMRRRHAPAHHFELAFAVGADAHDRRHHVGKDARQRRQIAGDVACDAKEPTDGFLAAGFGVKVTHRPCTMHPEYGRFAVGPAIVNAAAVDVATLAQRMTAQYFSHVAAMYVAQDDRAEALAPWRAKILIKSGYWERCSPWVTPLVLMATSVTPLKQK